MRFETLTASQVVILHQQILGDSESGLRPGGEHLLESALSRPSSSYAGVSLFDSTFQKAAALMEGIIQNHPFLDGNKRTAYNSAVILLRMNGYRLIRHTSDEDQADFVVSVANRQCSFDGIVVWLDRNFIRG